MKSSVSDVELKFNGQWCGRSASTWGQREQWLETGHRQHETRFNVGVIARLPRDTSLLDVLTALQRLFERHEALRTKFAFTRAGTPIQLVASGGSVSIQIRESDDARAEAVATKAIEELALPRFDLTSEWPARFAVIMDRGKPSYMAGSLSHMICDRVAGDILRREFYELLRRGGSTLLSVVPPQARDRAAYEQSEAGQEFLERSLKSWRLMLSNAQPLPLRQCPKSDSSSPQSYPRLRLDSRGTGRIAKLIAKQLNVGLSAVFTGAASSLLMKKRLISGTLGLTCANRFTPGCGSYVGTLMQQGIVRAEAADEEFPVVIGRAWNQILRTGRNSMYDPALLNALIAEAGLHDVAPYKDHSINFIQKAEPIFFFRDYSDVGGGEYVLRERAPVGPIPGRFSLRIVTDGEDAFFRIIGDGLHVALTDMHDVLVGMHELLWSMPIIGSKR